MKSIRHISLLVGGLIVMVSLTLGFVYWHRIHEVNAAIQCIDNLQSIEGAKEQMGLELGRASNYVTSWEEIRPWLPVPSPEDIIPPIPHCPAGGTYTLGPIGVWAKCSIPSHVFERRGIYMHITSASRRPISGVLVDVLDESGRHTKATTDEWGVIEVHTWPNKVISVVVSK